MSQRITIEIKDKIATCLTQLPIVCGNADYVIDFVFDEEWNTHNIKTALFVVNGKVTPRVFEGTVCPVPVIQNALMACVGVFAGAIDDGTLSTSTSALVKCTPCVTDGDNVPLPPPTDVYNQIIDLLNKYIAGGSGEVDVRTLQTKVDNALQTESKEVVGAINELNEIAKRADENSQNGTMALETANTANETATAAKETAERAEEKVDALDEISAQSLKLASQSFDLAKEAEENAAFAKERMVVKTEQASQLYGTDEEGNPALYPTDSVGTQVKVDGQKVKEFNADEKFDKTGGVIGGNVSIQGDLSVSGTTTTKDTETLQVKDNVIVANADGVELVDDSGFAIKTSTTSAYGIMYSPLGDGVKIGLGSFDENGKFVYDEGQAQFLATRADTLTDGNLPQWDNEKKQFVDSGAKIGDYVPIPSHTNYGNYIFMYMVTEAGKKGVIDSSMRVASTVVTNSIPLRGIGGVLSVGTPTADAHATTKKYVDDNFVPKPTDTSGYNRMYGIDAGNNPLMFSVQYPNYGFNEAGAPSRNGIPIYSSGNIGCAMPLSDYHAANKKYVDDNKGTKLYKHHIQFSITETRDGELEDAIEFDATFVLPTVDQLNTDEIVEDFNSTQFNGLIGIDTGAGEYWQIMGSDTVGGYFLIGKLVDGIFTYQFKVVMGMIYPSTYDIEPIE